MKKISEINYNRYIYYLGCPNCENVYLDDVPLDMRNKWCECGHKLIGICSDNKKMSTEEIRERVSERIKHGSGAISQYVYDS